MTEQDANIERLQLALEAAGLDLWENNLVTGEVTCKAIKIFAELGYGEDESHAYIDNMLALIHPDDIPLIHAAVNDHLTGITAQYRCEFRIRAKTGAWVWYANYGKNMGRVDGELGQRFIGVTFNIDDRKCKEDELVHINSKLAKQNIVLERMNHELELAHMHLRASEERLQVILDNAPIGIWMVDMDGQYQVVNKTFCNLTGIPENKFLAAHHLAEVLGSEVAAFCLKSDSECMAHDEPHLSYETLTFVDGKQHLLEITKVKLYDEVAEVVGIIGIAIDITERRGTEEEIRKLAFYDPLTSLPNRRLLLDRLQHALAFSARHDQQGALLFMDLDNFKTLNDTLGHDIGDLLLQQVAQRLVESVREGDTVARMGGDEFVIILEGLSEHPQDAAFQIEVLAEKILAALNQSYQLINHHRYITPSIGVAMFCGNLIPMAELMKRADIAMYSAKKAGRNVIRFFDPDMQAIVENRSALQESLKQALPQHQFTLYYQAQVDNMSKIIGAEVLLRWRHPERGILIPDEFIPIAEETGLIVIIGLWVLKTACQQLKLWESNPVTAHLHLAVNVSARQFQQKDFVDQVIGVFHETGINPAYIKLELTESMVLGNITEVISKMQALKKLGVKFSMDDFGTGHSSLFSLKKLPIDQLKIDQSFIHDIAQDKDGTTIVQTIIAMANNLGMEVIAEGVETEVQKNFLVKHSCLNFQGYLFAKPAPVEEFERMCGLQGHTA